MPNERLLLWLLVLESLLAVEAAAAAALEAMGVFCCCCCCCDCDGGCAREVPLGGWEGDAKREEPSSSEISMRSSDIFAFVGSPSSSPLFVVDRVVDDLG